jgi:hypothetical protein
MVASWLALTASLTACQGAPPRESTEPAPVASSKTAAHVQWPLGQANDYELELHTANNVGQSPVAVLLALSASVQVTFRSSNSGVRAELTLRDVQLLDHAKRPAEGAAQLAAELAQPFAFELDRTGGLLPTTNQLYEQALAEQRSTVPDVRHSAIQAIRLMDEPRVEPRLTELLASSDVSDAQSALQALGRRETTTESLVTRVEELARFHAAPMVRREAVLVLVKWREKWPGTERVIKERAEKDDDKRVRQAARNEGV